MRRVRGGAGFSGDSFAEIYVDTNFIGMDSRQPLLLTCNGVTAEEMRNEVPSENANLFVFFPFFKMIFTEFAQVFSGRRGDSPPSGGIRPPDLSMEKIKINEVGNVDYFPQNGKKILTFPARCVYFIELCVRPEERNNRMLLLQSTAYELFQMFFYGEIGCFQITCREKGMIFLSGVPSLM